MMGAGWRAVNGFGGRGASPRAPGHPERSGDSSHSGQAQAQSRRPERSQAQSRRPEREHSDSRRPERSPQGGVEGPHSAGASPIDPRAVGRWQTPLDDGTGRVRCDLCPRACTLRDGQRGFCFVRANHGGRIVLDTYGRSSGFAVDPVEKKPLNHFLPGSRVLSFGTAGCNSACKFCQNWNISRSRQWDTLASPAGPEDIAASAARRGIESVAFTYNDPIVFAEYAIDTATACREVGVHPIAVTAGYMSAAARPEFYGAMDAANIDLKGFTEEFYWKVTGTHLADVLETIEYAVNEARTPEGRHVWVELTTLLIPGLNDDDAQLHAECAWIREHCGPDVPLHFSAFHPDYKMRDVPSTPPSTLTRARAIAMGEGLRYVYTGNVTDLEGGRTVCPNPDCHAVLIRRDWYHVDANRVALDAAADDLDAVVAGNGDGTAVNAAAPDAAALDENRWPGLGGHCPDCGTPIAGVWG